MLSALSLSMILAAVGALMLTGPGSRPVKAAIAFAVFLALFATLPFFGLRPTIAVDNGGFLALLLCVGLAAAALRLMAGNKSPGLRHALLLAAIPILFLVGFATTSALFHADEYMRLVEVEEVAYDHATPILPQERIQMVDARRAGIRASELIGAEKGLGSMYKFGDFRIAIVKGRPTWVAPIVNTRTFAWLTGATTPGIVVVSAHDERDARLILDKPLSVHGPEDAFLGNVERKLWFAGYATSYLTDYALEVDDEFHPYWIASRYEKTIGFDGLQVRGVVTVDAVTGAVADHPVDKAPAWIDIVQPADIAVANLSYAGAYVHGWFNARFYGTDVIVPHEAHTIVQTLGGGIAFYSGMSTQSSQNGGTSGFALLDTRSPKVRVYTTPGISEEAAMAALEGIYQAEKYGATYPRLYMIAGRPTLVSLMVDQSGNPKAVGMVAQETRNVFGGGATVEEARRAYVSRFSAFTGGNLDEAVTATATFRVDRIGFSVAEGNTTAILVPPAGQVAAVNWFSVPASKFVEILVTEKGDQVTLGYTQTPTGEAVVTAFSNGRFPAPPPVQTIAPSPDPAAGETTPLPPRMTTH